MLQKLPTADLTCVVRFICYHERYFQVFKSSSKKRDLSDTSKTGEDPKKKREASCAKFVAESDDFNEGIDSPGCRVILFNCKEH